MAGKKATAKRRIKKMATKRAAKAARKALYEAMGQQNNNSKRQTKKRKLQAGVRGVSHASGSCGNIGCKRCNPKPYNILTCNQIHLVKAAPKADRQKLQEKFMKERRLVLAS